MALAEKNKAGRGVSHGVTANEKLGASVLFRLGKKKRSHAN